MSPRAHLPPPAIGPDAGHGRAVALAAVFALAVLAAFVLPQWGVLTPDTKPELYLNPGRMLGRELAAWRPVPALGSPNYHPGIAPVTAVVWALQQLGVAGWLSQRLLAAALVLAAAAGAGRLGAHLTGQRGLVPVTVGIAYALHPYAVVAGATLPIRLPHAALPWFVLASVLALRRGGWRWSAAAALAYAAMGGINGGIVNLLLALSLPVTAVVVSRSDDLSPRILARRSLGIAALCVVVSLYWLVPTLLAVGSTATDVAATTEAPEAVAGSSSPIESLRGLGMWTLYLVLGGRPEIPAHIAYLTSGQLVVATLGLPVLAAIGVAVGQRRARLLATGLIAVALPVMVGMHPPERPSPFGRSLRWAFEHVPGAIGFRTTNKIGSLLALGIAILVGGAVVARWRGRSMAPVVLTVIALAATPIWLGRAQPVALDIPAYWYEAAAATDTEDPGRLLFAPGNFQARYNWGYGGVDDLDTALFDERDVVWRPTVPAGSRPAHNLLTALDVGMNTGAVESDAAAAYLSLLGVSDVLVRADSENSRDGAAPATALLRTFTGIEGAEITGSWGPLVEQRDVLGRDTAPLPALVRVSLPDEQPARLLPIEQSLLVVGDSFAIADLVRAGHRVEGRDVAWADELADGRLRTALQAGGRIVLTDTNQRRRWDIRGLDRSHSEVLPATATLEPAATRARTTDPATQTTAVLEGGTAITSSDDTPALLRLNAANPPAFAADGDPNTAWRSGAFGSATNSWIRLDFDEELPLDPIRIVVDTDLDPRPTRLQVATATEDILVDVPRDGVIELSRASTSSWVRVAVAGVSGDGPGPVRIIDITVAGRSIRRGLAVPVLDVAPDLAEAVAATPLEVILTRLQGDPDDPADDEERRLLRTFSLPGERTLDVSATVRTSTPPADLLDAVAQPVGIVVTSDDPTAGAALGRATQAFDGDAETAWRPLGPSASLTVTPGSTQRVDAIVVLREEPAVPAVLRVEAAGRTHEAELRGPSTTILLPRPLRAGEFRLTLSSVGVGRALSPVQELELAGVRTSPIRPTTPVNGCVAIGDLDGAPVAVRVDSTVGALQNGRAVTLQGCDPVLLSGGEHRFDAGLGWLVDQVVLRSSPLPVQPPELPGHVDVLDESRTSRRLAVTASRPALLSTGIAWDPRWQASIDGRSLGPPVLAAGHAVGWHAPAGEYEVVIDYAPQGPVTAGFIASGVAVLVLVIIALTPSRRRP